MYADGLLFAANNFKNVIVQTGKTSISVNHSLLVKNTLLSFENKYFTASNKDFYSFFDKNDVINLPDNNITSARKTTFDINEYENFTVNQKEVAKPFVDKLLETNDPIVAKRVHWCSKWLCWCVGGAVMGGASGFLGGAVSGIASELLLSCFS